VDTGILDLYRTLWTAARDTFLRYRVAIVVEVAIITVWFVLRTAFDVESRPYLYWTVIACGVALVSPTSGLVILVATSPFFEPVSVSRALGMRHLLVAALGFSVALRVAVGGWRQLPRSPALIMGGIVAAITAAGVAHTIKDFDSDFGMHAAQMWLATIGGAMILLFVAAWVARRGVVRPLVAAALACALASVLCLVELVRPGLISQGPLGWIGFWKDFGFRVSGIIPAPNAIATMLIVPATVALAAIGQFHGRRRVAAATVALPLVVASVLTLSRSAIGALYLALVRFIALRRRRTALIALGIGIVLAVVSLPLFIQFRAHQAGLVLTQSPIEWLIGADEARVTAWVAAIRMWEASPIVGHGFLSYKVLADSFGDVRLGSPHNEVLRLFAEEGLVGGIAIVVFIACLFRELARRPGWIGAGLLAGAVGYWLAAMFNNPLLFIQVSATAFVYAGFGLTAPISEEVAGTNPSTSESATASA
jgi:O-antigen ligase